MMAQPITSGQDKQIVRFVADAAEAAAKTAVAQATFLDKDSAQLVIERGDELRVAIERAIINALKKLGSRYPVLAETRLLKPVAQATVPARTKPFNAAEFYQTGPGLFVFDTFAERLDLSARQTLDSAPARSYVASILKSDAYDKDIRKELPENHLSTLEDIAGFIEAQPEGKQGFLLNDGYANIFYVAGKNGEVFVVVVRWLSDDREWLVRGWGLVEGGDWDADNQVLCPGNASI